jgi:hypothetical protein
MPRYPATKIPPSCENISIDLAKRVLAESWGNVSEAADALGVPSRDFRLLVRTTPVLTAVVDEVNEIFCDKAEAILREALESEHELRRDVASRFAPSRVSGASLKARSSSSLASMSRWKQVRALTPWNCDHSCG